MLNSINFKSIFKNELKYFIKYKRSLGFKYENEVYRLHYIDNVLNTLKLKSKKITKEIFYKLTQKKNKQGANYVRQYSVTKDFCKYLISSGYKNIYYKNMKFNITNNYQPIIFNNKEITLLFQKMDEYKNINENKKDYKINYAYSILFRLIYACGLRISEVINLTIDDINFIENSINIINSKRHTSRRVIFSNSMRKCLIDYINLFEITDGFLFTTSDNKELKYYSLKIYYKKMLKLSNLDTNAHIHDLRHVFCNNALNQMLERGYDENVIIVYLYKYMGHKTIIETEYYLHFTDYNKRKLIDINDNFSKELYKGVDLENE